MQSTTILYRCRTVTNVDTTALEAIDPAGLYVRHTAVQDRLLSSESNTEWKAQDFYNIDRNLC